MTHFAMLVAADSPSDLQDVLRPYDEGQPEREAKWDWWVEGGRYQNALRTKNGDMVTTCRAGDVDWEWYKGAEPGQLWPRYSSNGVPFFGFLSSIHGWNARSELTWFAISYDPNDAYADQFWQFVKELDDEQRLFVVDCHME